MRTCNDNSINSYMDKFYFAQKFRMSSTLISGKIKSQSRQKCWTWFIGSTDLQINDCKDSWDGSTGPQQQFTHDTATGRLCLKHFPTQCVTGINQGSTRLRVVEVTGLDEPVTVAPQTPAPQTDLVWYEIDAKVSAFGRI